MLFYFAEKTLSKSTIWTFQSFHQFCYHILLLGGNSFFILLFQGTTGLSGKPENCLSTFLFSRSLLFFPLFVLSINLVCRSFEHKIRHQESQAPNGVAQLGSDCPVEAASCQGSKGSAQGSKGTVNTHNDSWKIQNEKIFTLSQTRMSQLPCFYDVTTFRRK